MPEFELRCTEDELRLFAARYPIPTSEETILGFKDAITNRGYITRAELRTIAQWKSPRRAGDVNNNPEEYVTAITKFALSTPNARASIEVLTKLDGLQWPTASVILHLYHRKQYPILDFRALWSLSVDVPGTYKFSFWWSYVEYCRGLAERTGLDMRTLDRALWQYSKENQP